MALRKKIEFLSILPRKHRTCKVHIAHSLWYIGDFRTKNEALKLYREIKDTYPVAFIVTDQIDFPLLKQKQ